MKSRWKSKFAPLMVALAAIVALLVGGAVAAQAQTTVAARASADAKAKKCQRNGSLNTREKVVCIAKSQLGVKERGVKKRKSNNCQKYFRDFGSKLNCDDDVNGQWCAAFTRWVWTKAGVSRVPKSFGVSSWAGSLGKSVKTPKPGDVAVSRGQTHIEIVVKVSGGKVYTIDGNGGRDDVRKGSHRRGGMTYYRMPS